MRLTASILAAFGSTCTRAPAPPIYGVELHFSGTVPDALTVAGRLADRRFTITDPAALAKVRVSWSTATALGSETYADELVTTLERAGFAVQEGDPTIIGPGPADVRRISLVYVKLQVDDLEKVAQVDLNGTWFHPIRPGRAVVSCACTFPIVPVVLTNAAVSDTPPDEPLLVDVVASEPRLAVIRDEGSARARVVAPGDFLADGREIVDIAEDGVLLDDGAAVSRFEVVRPKAKVALTGSVQAGPDGYRVAWSALRPYLTPNTARLLGAALPSRGSDGAVTGVRLSAIQRGELPAALGFENGDVVHQAGDVQVRGVEDFPAVVRALEQPGELCVRVSRRGEPIRLCYTLHGD